MAIAQVNANICQGAATTLSLGSDLGPTSEDGIVMTVTPTFYDHKNDQVKGVHKKTLINREVVLAFSLTESDVTRLHLALNEAAGSLSGSSLTIDDTQAADAALSIVGVAPGGNTRTWIFDACQVRGAASVATSKNAPAMLAMEVEALYDLTASRFGIVGDS